MNEQQEIKYAQSIRNQRVDMFLKVSRGLEDLDLTDPQTRKFYLSNMEHVQKTEMWSFEVEAFLNKSLVNLAFTRQQNTMPGPEYDQNQIITQQLPPSQQMMPQQIPQPQRMMNSCPNIPPQRGSVVENPGYQQQQMGGIYMGNEQQYGQPQMQQQQYAQRAQQYPQGLIQGDPGQMPQMPQMHYAMLPTQMQQSAPPNKTTYYAQPNPAQYYGNMVPQQHGPMSYAITPQSFNIPPPNYIPPPTQTTNSWDANSFPRHGENVYNSQQNNATGADNFRPEISENHWGSGHLGEQVNVEQIVEEKSQASIKQIVSEIIEAAEKTKAQKALPAKPASGTNKVDARNVSEPESKSKTSTNMSSVCPTNPVVFPALPSLKTSSEPETHHLPQRTEEPSYAEKASKKASEFHYTEQPTAPVEPKQESIAPADPWKVSESWTPKNSKSSYGGGKNYFSKQNKSDNRGNNKKNYKKPPPKQAVLKDPVVEKPETTTNAISTWNTADAPPTPPLPSAPTLESVKSSDSSKSSSIAEEVEIPKFEDAIEELKGLDISPISPSPSSCYSSVGSQPEQKPKPIKSGGNKKKTAPKAPKKKSKAELKLEDDYLSQVIAENEKIKSEQAAKEAEERIIKMEREELEQREKKELEEMLEKERISEQKRQEEVKEQKQRQLGEMQRIQAAFLNEIHVETIDDDDVPEQSPVFTFNFKGGPNVAALCARVIHGMRLYQQKMKSERNKVFTKEEIEALPKFQRSVVEANIFSAKTQIERDILVKFIGMRKDLHSKSGVPGDSLRNVFYSALEHHLLPCMYPSVLHLLYNDDGKTIDQLETDFIRMLLELRSEVDAEVDAEAEE